jgi:hypothetical protein
MTKLTTVTNKKTRENNSKMQQKETVSGNWHSSRRINTGKFDKCLHFLSVSYCPKGYYGPGHSIRIAEYHREKLLSVHSISTRGPRQFVAVVALVPVICSPKLTTLVLAPFLYCA